MSIINTVDLCALNIFKFIDFDFVLDFYNMIEIELFSHKVITIKINAFNWNLKCLSNQYFFFLSWFLIARFRDTFIQKESKKKEYKRSCNDSTFTNILWRSNYFFDVCILRNSKFDAWFKNKRLCCFLIAIVNRIHSTQSLL